MARVEGLNERNRKNSPAIIISVEGGWWSVPFGSQRQAGNCTVHVTCDSVKVMNDDNDDENKPVLS